MKTFQKLMVANRGEIAIRVFRTATELGIRTVAIYSHEDRYALHRFKADEAYQVGSPGEPIRAYLDIPGIIRTAKQHGVDCLHPGYGFLSENPDLAKACEEAGIAFIGPRVDILQKLGDKVEARQIAEEAGAPILPGSESPLSTLGEALQLADELAYPVMLKAAKGGGGRGMRVVQKKEQLETAFEQARRESLAAFGSADVFLEKFIAQPRHIEVQILGDQHEHLVHLYERDCSVQRRHQKVVEIAPALKLDTQTREELCLAAVKIGNQVAYNNAGTVEFLLDTASNQFYFIEVNPRIQVEHTVTEAVTGIDIVKCQILIAQGIPLSDPSIDLGNQSTISTRGYALQCRVTTEDPENQFLPDYGRIGHYRSGSGMGIRLDAGTAFSGALVTPYYDSLLVKVTSSSLSFLDSARRMKRALLEFRVRGVKTNIPFLVNLVTHPQFLSGGCTTRFLDETPELFQFEPHRDRATKLFEYLADVTVNGHPLVPKKPEVIRRLAAPVPEVNTKGKPPEGTRQKFKELGGKKFGEWVLNEKRLLITDTTFRDAHQSLLATRMRTYDMLQIADHYAYKCSDLFSLEMWGGATFDTSMRFLKESPWQRLTELRTKIPNILFQMLLRASNAVGYSNYPDNIVKSFVKEAVDGGIDVFRIFDPLNWVENMELAMEAVIESGGLCEAAICYTGDITDPKRTKYDLNYYVELAKALEKRGAHILAVKDMAGLCKPFAAQQLVKALKEAIGIPVHFHTHDTSGVQAASILMAAEEGLDVSDAACAPLSGLTSQPNLNSLIESLKFQDRDTKLDSKTWDDNAIYWKAVREFYQPFESGLQASTADVYFHEMPGGQYTNLYKQAEAIGLGERWPEVCKAYAEVNRLVGDIVKVTPTSKAVGDLALYMVTNDLTEEDLLNSARDLSFPASIVDLMSGRMGQPMGGFPENLQQRILRGEAPLTERPGETLPPADFEATAKHLEKLLNRPATQQEILAYLMYSKVFEEFVDHEEKFSDTSILPTPIFLYGLEAGIEETIELELGKTLFLKMLAIGDPHPDGTRTIFFELNGQPRNVTVVDRSLEDVTVSTRKADPKDPLQIAAPMPGMVVTVAVAEGDEVKQGQKLVTMEAMKMETTVYAENAGKVAELLAKPGLQVETGDLLLCLEE
ncbi:Pyruvate carboxylase [Planctomycetales bacterium 10988]|nr:Pyruvate carboxylase [Planctomycetales bacterium 10988]